MEEEIRKSKWFEKVKKDYTPSFRQQAGAAEMQRQIDARRELAMQQRSAADEEAANRPRFFGRKKSRAKEDELRDSAGELDYQANIQQGHKDAGRIARNRQYSREKMPRPQTFDASADPASFSSAGVPTGEPLDPMPPWMKQAKAVKPELKGKQKKLDADGDGDIDAEDFKELRERKK